MAKGKIDYDTVVAATGGDALAAGAVLDYFNDFMDGLCTGFYTDADGFWDYGHRPLDEIVYAGEALACDVKVSAVKDATCNKQNQK